MGRIRNKSKSKSFNIFSTNSAGLKIKSSSFKNQIHSLDAATFTIQETNFTKKGNLKIEEYEVFEAIRAKKFGGTLVGVHKALDPVLIETYSDDFELIVVKIIVANK